MKKITQTYTTLDGEEITEDFYFNLTKAELLELELDTEGSVENFVQKCKNHKDAKAIAAFVKNILIKSYGERTLDGRSFVKSINGESLGERFSYCAAFSDIYIELISSADSLANFLKEIIPPLEKNVEAVLETPPAA